MSQGIVQFTGMPKILYAAILFFRLSIRQESGSTDGRMILAIPRGPLPRANPIDFMAFPQGEDLGARATDRRRGFAKVVELGQTWPVSASGRCGLLLIGR